MSYKLADDIENKKPLIEDIPKPAEEKKGSLVEGQTYTVSGTIPKDSSNIRPGDKVIFQKMSNDQY
jgi:hypothetical protein